MLLGAKFIAGFATEVTLAAAKTVLDAISAKLPSALVSDRLKVDGSGVTQPISAASLPLATDAATATNQTTEIAGLAAILAKLTADPATQTTLAAVLAKIIAAPATEAKQDTGNTSLASILAKFTDTLARFGVLGGDGTSIASFANAIPVFGGLLSNHSAATIPATGAQVKASPGSAYSINYKNDTGFTRYIQIHNSLGQPVNGTRSVWSSAAVATGTAATLQIGHTISGGCCSTAVYLVLSSSIFSYTAVADTAVQVELLYK